jgi:hypothetical protein
VLWAEVLTTPGLFTFDGTGHRRAPFSRRIDSKKPLEGRGFALIVVGVNAGVLILAATEFSRS